MILAHPDDESFPVGGTLARYAAEGDLISLVSATRGEAGVRGLSPSKAAAVREGELRAAAKTLGLAEVRFLDRPDGELAGADEESLVSTIAGLIKEIRAEVVITFGPEGISGHADHVAVSRLTTAAFDRVAANSGRRLYYIVPSEATSQGCGVPPPAEAVGGLVAFIDVKPYLVRKVRAAQKHRSQTPPFPGDPEVESKRLACHEVFRLARPAVGGDIRGPLTDLFADIPAASLYE